MMDIASRLRNARDGKSRVEVCKALGISLSALSMYETGKRVPRDETKKKMAQLYHTTVESLFY